MSKAQKIWRHVGPRAILVASDKSRANRQETLKLAVTSVSSENHQKLPKQEERGSGAWDITHRKIFNGESSSLKISSLKPKIIVA